MRIIAIIGALAMLATPGLAQANRYYFCSAFGQTGNNGVPGWQYAQVMGGVVVMRDGYRDGEYERMKREFEEVVLKSYERATDLLCYNHAASDRATRELIAKSAESYRSQGRPVKVVAFDRDYTGGVPSGTTPSRAPGVYFVPPKSTAPAAPRADGLTEADIRRREAAADADLAAAKASYAQQIARQQAEYRRVADENARRQAAYQAKIAQDRAAYQAKVAAREAEIARTRAEWAAQAARCKAGDKKACVSRAAER